MSIVHLHSKGSSPNNFTNYFKQGLNLPRNTKVRMLGYSINVSKSEKEEITATEGNNKYMVIIGDQAKQSVVNPMNREIKEASYDLSVAPNEFTNAIKEVLNAETPYKKVYIVRSLIATREVGSVLGDIEDKSRLYQVPYEHMVKYMFQMSSDEEFQNLYRNLKEQNIIEFWSTSFLRGTTLDDAIVIVDEFENLNFHELDSIITRVGQNSKIFFCGDATQTDLEQTVERNGIVDFIKILRRMPSLDIIEFGIDDIVRSGLVKEYLIGKLEEGL